ncbi:MAG: SpoIIE family protein phosphatase [Desulforhopalus sp.]
MDNDANKICDELRHELTRCREQLRRVENQCQALSTSLKQRDLAFARECEKHHEALEALSMAQLIVDRSPVILFRRKAGDDPQLEYISDNIRLLGYAPEEFLEGEIHFRDIVYEKDKKRVRDEIRGFAEADLEEYTQCYRVVTKSGEIRWVEDQTSVVRDKKGTKIHNQGILIDITDRKSAEEKLKKSEEKYRRIVETAGEGFLLMDENLRIVDLNDAYCRMIGYGRQDLLGKTPLDLATEASKAYMLANREKLLGQEYREFEGGVVGRDGRTIPVLIHGNTLRDDSGTIIGNMAFVTDMTAHKKALVLAGEVQKSLLPHKNPHVAGLDIAGRNVSCDEIGGDYFDFLWHHSSHEGTLSIVVGDISGHGVDSALLMTTARAFLRMRASQPGTVSEIISEMNHHLASDVLDTGRFMTLFYLTVDIEQRTLTWVRAGHDPALVYSPDSDEFEELKGSGVALGVRDEVSYTENRREGLHNGQIIAIGTDGIWEAFNAAGQMFGKKRLCDIIQNHADASAEDLLSEVYDEVKRFMGGNRPQDDITLVIIKVEGLQ